MIRPRCLTLAAAQATIQERRLSQPRDDWLVKLPFGNRHSIPRINVSRSQDALVNPELLEWARESAGMSRDEAAERMQVQPHRLYAWEEGIDRPTIKQLRSLASIYRQSLAAFFLPTPPAVFKPPLHDYRRLPDGVVARISPELALEIRDALDRRSLCLELYGETRQRPPKFNQQTTLERDPEATGETVRRFLGVTDDAQRGWKNAQAAFSFLRDAIESKGVLVFQSKKAELAEMRGYSIAQFPLPVIVVNRKDAPASRIFTLLHELTHLMLRSGGVCDLEEEVDRSPADQRVEVYCNHVAGAALVSRQSLLSHAIVRSHGAAPAWRQEELAALARQYSVSREVVLRRLFIAGHTSKIFYEKTHAQLQPALYDISVTLAGERGRAGSGRREAAARSTPTRSPEGQFRPGAD